MEEESKQTEKNAAEKEGDIGKDNKIQDTLAKDIIKLINLLNIKLFSEEDSSIDNFFVEIKKVLQAFLYLNIKDFIEEINNVKFLYCLKDIFEECQAPKDIFKALKSQISQVIFLLNIFDKFSFNKKLRRVKLRKS